MKNRLFICVCLLLVFYSCADQGESVSEEGKTVVEEPSMEFRFDFVELNRHRFPPFPSNLYSGFGPIMQISLNTISTSGDQVRKSSQVFYFREDGQIEEIFSQTNEASQRTVNVYSSDNLLIQKKLYKNESYSGGFEYTIDTVSETSRLLTASEIETSEPSFSERYSILENGNSIKSRVTEGPSVVEYLFNYEDGRLIDHSEQSEHFNTKYLYKYDESQNVTNILKVIGGEEVEKTVYEYQSGRLIKVTLFRNGSTSPSVVRSYSEHDSFGNWLTLESETSTGKKTEVNRVISYYEEYID